VYITASSGCLVPIAPSGGQRGRRVDQVQQRHQVLTLLGGQLAILDTAPPT
jgi:hypothetical protein